MVDYRGLRIFIAQVKRELEYWQGAAEEIRFDLSLAQSMTQHDPNAIDLWPYEYPLKFCLDRIAHLRAKIADLENLLPCQPFLDLFGLQMYEYYRQRYPINRHTKLVAEKKGRWEVEYLFPADPPAATPSIDSTPSALLVRHGAARFERFVYNVASGIYLAWAPEINTVFYWS